MAIQDRAYLSETDYSLMRRLLVEILGRTGPPVYATIGNLDWWRVAEDDPRSIDNTQLWFDGPERLAAFAWPIEGQVDIIVHPDYPSLHNEALAWSEAYFRGKGVETSESWQAWAYTRDTPRIAALERRGYRRTAKGLVVYGQAISGPVPEPSLPVGYAIRNVLGPEESEARAAVQRAAFGSEWMTTERHARVLASPTYRPELDIVIVAPDGSFAGFALIWLDEVNRLGVFEPLGVAADHQRRGLGRALMMAGLRKLQEHGADFACVETGLNHDEARRLYEATGFDLLDTDYAWLPPELDPV